jgi:hypothetical protein
MPRSAKLKKARHDYAEAHARSQHRTVIADRITFRLGLAITEASLRSEIAATEEAIRKAAHYARSIEAGAPERQPFLAFIRQKKLRVEGMEKWVRELERKQEKRAHAPR